MSFIPPEVAQVFVFIFSPLQFLYNMLLGLGFSPDAAKVLAMPFVWIMVFVIFIVALSYKGKKKQKVKTVVSDFLRVRR